MSHVWPPPALDGWPERAKMAPHHNPICVTSVWVRWIPKVSITVVLTTKRVTEKAKKLRKVAILWQFLSHRGSLMAPRHLQLEYPLAPMIWSAFGHFWMSGSTHCWQLLSSFTEAIRVASPFGSIPRLYGHMGYWFADPFNFCWIINFLTNIGWFWWWRLNTTFAIIGSIDSEKYLFAKNAKFWISLIYLCAKYWQVKLKFVGEHAVLPSWHFGNVCKFHVRFVF